MRHLAGFSLTWASVFLAIVALLIGSPALFYITTALIATIGACHLQAYLSVRGLRLARVAPENVKVGDLVTIEIKVWSMRKIRRTLITVWDNLPAGPILEARTPSLPIAPSYIAPVTTQYQFRVLKRGRYRWSGVYVNGTDALGLISKTRIYETTAAEMVVLPSPLPLLIELPAAAGWGINESESGQNRGAGIEPRGIREYRYGDSIRQIHWPSTARTGQLLVKEFEAGTHAAVGFCIQRGRGTEVGSGAVTTLEQMCGNVAYLADTYIHQGAKVYLPNLDDRPSHYAPQERIAEIYNDLASLQAQGDVFQAEDIETAVQLLPFGSVLYVLTTLEEHSIFKAIEGARSSGLNVVALIYNPSEFSRAAQYRTLGGETLNAFAEALRVAGATTILVPKTIGDVHDSAA